eukprot:CAMPEP_0196578906 /NCGR_PEP_ID=MMETSP1081-20130531/12383_1 /TAXON_ID=36882 /ORGANISM="Pyramimonas amylifera, Strain CCMP720" /LENGTH=233 /DNA_ID=CAMNT_0041898295 /DNA_START=367 /DNA_END=1068 /DNA_ORIENTATION=-
MPYQLTVTSLKSALLHFAPVFDEWLTLLKQQEENNEEDQPFPPFPDVKPSLFKTAYAIVRSTVAVTVRRVMERILAFKFCSSRTMWKLMKDIPGSARKKAGMPLLEAAPRVSRAAKMTRTCARGYILIVVSDALVQQSLITYKAVGQARQLRKANQSTDIVWQKLARQSVHNLAKMVGILTAASLACGVVVLLRPRECPRIAYWGTLAALSVGDLLGDLAVGLCCDEWAFGEK